MSKFGIFLFSFTAVVTLLAVFLPEGVESSPSLEDSLNVAEALRYLEEMDKIYATISRPRFGRSIGSNRRASGINAGAIARSLPNSARLSYDEQTFTTILESHRSNSPIGTRMASNPEGGYPPINATISSQMAACIKARDGLMHY